MTDHIPARRGLTLALACAAQFMVVLDIAIVNVALPSIQADLGLAQSSLQWVVIAYGLMLGGFLLLGGRLGDHLGRRRVLVTGLAVFTAASLLAGIADSGEQLIGARAIQGLGAALIPPSALAIIATTFTQGEERNRALGLYGAVAGVSASVGVIASGLLTDSADWRWVFYINVPVGAILIALAATVLPRDTGGRSREPFDVAGAVTVTGGLLTLTYAVSRGVEEGWTAGLTLGLFAVSAALIMAFVAIESRSDAPLVPGSILRNRSLVAANLAAFTTFGGFFAFIFVGSLLMQQGLGYSATMTGVAWLTTSVASFFAAGLAGAVLVKALGVRRLLAIGQLLFAAAAAGLAFVPGDASFWTDLFPWLLLTGLAVGAAAPAAQIGALTGVAEPQAGLASGLIETLRELGGVVVVAAVSTVMATALADSPAVPGDATSAGTVDALHAAAWVIVIVAAAGAAITWVAFGRNPAPPSPSRETAAVTAAVTAAE
jgi:EmrB/QacA subfamily drug resistance transporter